MDKKAAAAAVLSDEIVELAFTQTLDRINKALLNAKTPAEREERWNEYHGLNRAWVMLKKWPHEAADQGNLSNE